MNKKLSIAMGIALAGMTGFASAEEAASDFEFSANVALTTDYVFRGVSQTDEDPAIQGGFDVGHSSGIYAGTWASNVEGYDGASMEIDFYIGWAGDVGPVGLDVGYLHYEYPDVDNSDNNTDEFHIGISKDFEMVSLGATYHYSDEWYGDDSSEYFDFSAEVPVGQFTIAAHYGMTEGDGANADYDDYSLGVSTELGGFGFDLSFYDTDSDGSDAFGEVAEDRFVFTVSKSL